MQELRTLVDDVVPVLFQTVLGRADDDLRRSSSTSSARTTSTTGSGRSRSSFTHNPTKPIVDMGITLERLKTLHERMPKQDPDLLMAWANDARRVYEEYLSVWRMGFQDVVVAMPKRYEDEDNSNTKHASVRSRKELEFLHGARKEDLAHKYEGDPSTWEMPPPPADDDEEQHEKVDVAFLLKRPLVRLKALAKLFKVRYYHLCLYHIASDFLGEIWCKMGRAIWDFETPETPPVLPILHFILPSNPILTPLRQQLGAVTSYFAACPCYITRSN